MVRLNQVLLVLIVLLALSAAVFSYLLFQRRAEFRERGEEMATTLTDTVQVLDETSKTGTTEEVTYEPADTEAGTPESGTLSWQAYHEEQTEADKFDKYGSTDFSDSLENVLTLTEGVEEQRNNLAQGLFQMGLSLGLPEDYFSLSGLQELQLEKPEYSEQINTLVEHAKLVNERDEAMIQTLSECAEIIDESIDVTQLSERGESMANELGDFGHESVLADFEDAIEGLKGRSDAYVETLKNAPEQVENYDWDVRVRRLDSKRAYENALATMEEDFEAIEAELGRIPILEDELDETKKQLAETEEKLQAVQSELAEVKDKGEGDTASDIIKKKDQKIQDLKKRVERLVKDQVKFKGKLEAQIVDVNQDWGFVLLDAGIERLAEGTELLVGRSGEFVNRLKVTRVTADNAVADIVGRVSRGDIREGDKVLYAPSAKEKTESEEKPEEAKG